MKTVKFISLILALLLAVTAFCSCASDSGENIGTQPGSEASDGADNADEEDSEEAAGEIRIVSTAADITEILDGLGFSSNIVAADTYSVGIGDVGPEICTLDYTNIDAETVLALSPDLVFVSSSSTDGTYDPYSVMEDVGLNVINIPTAQSIQGIKDNIMTIADSTNSLDRADELIMMIDDAVAEAEKRAEGREAVKVYFEISAAPWLYTFGSGTYLDEIISICGGENIYSSESGWLSNTEESVLAANPDVIITNVMYDGYDYNEIYSREGWDVINAVKNTRVYSVDANASSRGSQNIVKAIAQISAAICPEDAESENAGE